MDLGSPVADQLIAKRSREGQVGDLVAVDVAEFAAAEAELGATEAMGCRLHARPTEYG